MSKSVRSTIVNKEKARRKTKEAETNEYILKNYNNELERKLANLEDYSGQEICFYNQTLYDVQLLTRLGFEYKYNGGIYGEVRFLIRVPPMTKGKVRTVAQKLLFKFEKQLKKARRERKKELKGMCKEVEEKIKRKEFSCESIEDDGLIKVKANQSLKYYGDKDFISSYFLNKIEKIHFSYEKDGIWFFKSYSFD